MSAFRPLPIGTTPKVKRGAVRLMKAWVQHRDEARLDPDDPVAAFKQDSAYGALVSYVLENNLAGTLYDPRPRT